ncbi:spore coat polysaccharide biosynthesis protein SpsF [Gammaproteobacteria bacterium]
MKPNPRVVGIIQARLGSSRLPRKVLADLQGEPMIGRILERISLARCIQATGIATTTESSDDDLVEYSQRLGIGVYRGSVDDLAARLYGAAHAFGAEVIVRIWGDCPCADPAVIDLAVERLLVEDLDYISNSITIDATNSIVLTRTYPYGLDLEVYQTAVLGRLCATTIDPFYREFPFEWVKAHSAELRVGTMPLTENWSHIYLTVDYPEDLALIREIYQGLYQPGIAFGWREVVDWLKRQPELIDRVTNLIRNPEYYQKLNARKSGSQEPFLI